MYFLIDWIAWGRVKRRSVTLLTLVLNPSYPLYDHPKEEEKGQEKNRWSRDSSIWLTLCGKCNILPIMMSWEGTYRWLASSIKGNSLSSLITRLMFAAIVYGIWRERNSRIFHGKSFDAGYVCYEIVFWVRARVNSLRGLLPSQENSRFLHSWGISPAIFNS